MLKKVPLGLFFNILFLALGMMGCKKNCEDKSYPCQQIPIEIVKRQMELDLYNLDTLSKLYEDQNRNTQKILYRLKKSNYQYLLQAADHRKCDIWACSSTDTIQFGDFYYFKYHFNYESSGKSYTTSIIAPNFNTQTYYTAGISSYNNGPWFFYNKYDTTIAGTAYEDVNMIHATYFNSLNIKDTVYIYYNNVYGVIAFNNPDDDTKWVLK